MRRCLRKRPWSDVFGLAGSDALGYRPIGYRRHHRGFRIPIVIVICGKLKTRGPVSGGVAHEADIDRSYLSASEPAQPSTWLTTDDVGDDIEEVVAVDKVPQGLGAALRRLSDRRQRSTTRSRTLRAPCLSGPRSRRNGRNELPQLFPLFGNRLVSASLQLLLHFLAARRRGGLRRRRRCSGWTICGENGWRSDPGER
jgi:hypothetical protein